MCASAARMQGGAELGPDRVEAVRVDGHPAAQDECPDARGPSVSLEHFVTF